MNMKEWAEREVALVLENGKKYTKKDDMDAFDYAAACCKSALKAFNSLMEDNHSGMSINITKAYLNNLIDGRPLTPIDDIDEVWNKCEEREDKHGAHTYYQCNRMFSLFKNIYENGNIVFKDSDRIKCTYINNPNVYFRNGFIRDIIDEMFPITMPYSPKEKSFIVYCDECLTDINNGDFDTVAVLYCIKPDGAKVDINRFFKEEPGEMIEIDDDEYKLRVELSISKETK